MKSEIKAFAAKIGISIVGFCKAELPEGERKRFREWIAAGFAADMGNLGRNIEERLLEKPLLAGQRSVILCGFPYPAENEGAWISDYALLNDYHVVVRERLEKLAAGILEKWPEAQTRLFVDTAPVWEKALAVEAGLGFIGKNTLLVHPVHGTRLFLGGLLTTLELEPDQPVAGNGCGNCDACVRACPTQALSGKGLDAQRCLSYHTIENKGEIPEEFRRSIREKVFGCSICEKVCPGNRAFRPVPDSDWARSNEPAVADLEGLQAMCRDSFRKYFGGTPVYRTGKKTLLRNIAIAMGNRAQKDYIS